MSASCRVEMRVLMTVGSGRAARESASPVPVVVPMPVIPPASALKKGETPQYVARTIDLDLGDF